MTTKERLNTMEKELKDRLDAIESTVKSILSILKEVYLPNQRKEIQTVIL